MVDLDPDRIEYHKRQMVACPGADYKDRQQWYNTLLLAGLHKRLTAIEAAIKKLQDETIERISEPE